MSLILKIPRFTLSEKGPDPPNIWAGRGGILEKGILSGPVDVIPRHPEEGYTITYIDSVTSTRLLVNTVKYLCAFIVYCTHGRLARYNL